MPVETYHIGELHWTGIKAGASSVVGAIIGAIVNARLEAVGVPTDPNIFYLGLLIPPIAVVVFQFYKHLLNYPGKHSNNT